MSQIVACALSFIIALVGIFFTKDFESVRTPLAVVAAISFLISVIIQIQSNRETAFIRRSLENLIRAYTPSDRLAYAMVTRVMNACTKKGLQGCRVAKFTYDHDEFRYEMTLFSDGTYKVIRGYYILDHEQVAEWSLLDEKNLDKAIESLLFVDTVGKNSKEGDLSPIMSLISEVTTGLYPDTKRGKRNMYAANCNSDTHTIGVPFPSSISSDAKYATLSHVHFKSDELDEYVPAYTFSKEMIDQLRVVPRMRASEMIINWLGAAWGEPTRDA